MKLETIVISGEDWVKDGVLIVQDERTKFLKEIGLTPREIILSETSIISFLKFKLKAVITKFKLQEKQTFK